MNERKERIKKNDKNTILNKIKITKIETKQNVFQNMNIVSMILK